MDAFFRTRGITIYSLAILSANQPGGKQSALRVILNTTVNTLAKVVSDYLKSQEKEIIIEIKLESKTISIGKQSSDKEIEDFVQVSKSQYLTIKTKF